jgi:hypothetical protein
MKITIKKEESNENVTQNGIFYKGKLDKLATVITRKIAIPMGFLTADLDVLIRFNKINPHAVTYFDALPIIFFSMPLTKKILDGSIEKLRESVYFKNKKLYKYSKVGILSSATYFISEGCATYNAIVSDAVSKPLSTMNKETAEFFFLGLASIGVGIISLGLSKKAELKKYRRE